METKSPGSGWESAAAANEAVPAWIFRQVSVETPVTAERKLPENLIIHQSDLKLRDYA